MSTTHGHWSREEAAGPQPMDMTIQATNSGGTITVTDPRDHDKEAEDGTLYEAPAEATPTDENDTEDEAPEIDDTEDKE